MRTSGPSRSTTSPSRRRSDTCVQSCASCAARKSFAATPGRVFHFARHSCRLRGERRRSPTMAAFATHSQASAELLERTAELAALEDAFTSSAEEGRGRLLLISGEAGVGKTALVRAFCGD